MHLRIGPFILASVLVCRLIAAGLTAAEPAGVTVALTGFRLIDGTGRAPVENAVLVVRDDKVSAVGPSDSVKCPQDAQLIDCRGQTIIPGLIADHSHVGVVDGTSIKPEDYNRQNILRQLRQYEAYGVTTVMALGLNGDLFYPRRDQQHASRSPGADLFGADRGIGAPLGAPPAALLPVGDDQIYRPATASEAAADVRQMAARHPDLIKLWLDDLLGTAPKLRPEIYQAVIEEAHRLGLRVACHIYYLDDAKAVLRAGVDVIAHGVRDKPVDAEFIEQLKARPAWYIATLGLDETSYLFAEQPGWRWRQSSSKTLCSRRCKPSSATPLICNGCE
jgi:imidazolonepropionase-like amidohydrolase